MNELNALLAGGENALLSKRPYIATHGRFKGQSVVCVNTGQRDESGNPVYTERPINTNATLRKDEWVDLEDQILESARERLVIVDDMVGAGLTYNVGGLGTLISEWEDASEMTDAIISMDGETVGEKDRQEFGLNGVPIPVIHKEFSISERQLLASRNRGAALDVTQGVEAGRSVARRSEKLVFFGGAVGKSTGYTIPGLLTFPGRASYTIADWSDTANVTPEDILKDIHGMIRKLETEERHYGPYTLYVPGAYAFRFREDFKANSDKTLMQRVLDEDVIKAVRFSDVLPTGNVLMIQMERTVLDLAVASDIATVQWASGSGWTNHFQVFAAWAPRLKQSHDGYCGICHGATA